MSTGRKEKRGIDILDPLEHLIRSPFLVESLLSILVLRLSGPNSISEVIGGKLIGFQDLILRMLLFRSVQTWGGRRKEDIRWKMITMYRVVNSELPARANVRPMITCY